MEKHISNILIIDHQTAFDAFSAQLTHFKDQIKLDHFDHSQSLIRSFLFGNAWDIIICDPELPNFDFVDFLAQVKLFHPETLVVINTSSKHLHEDIDNLLQLGIYELLKKDTPAQLIATIARALVQLSLQYKKETAEAQVKHLTQFDLLTGLPNRAYFMELAHSRLVQLQQQSNLKGLICYLDIHSFNRINDIFGYEFGDQAILACANRLKQIPEVSLLGRLGQDEFAIFCEHIHSIQEAEHFAAAILYEFDQLIQIHHEEFYVNFNIGLALYPEHGHEVQTLIKNAESAMFAAKKQPEKFFHAYNATQHPIKSHALAIETALHHVEQRNELFLNFQPFYDITHETLVGAEVLLRWKHPKFGMIPPAQFISVADECKLIIPIGQWVLEQTCIQLKIWQDMGFRDMVIAVNVSPIQFRDNYFITRLLSTVRASGIDPGGLEIEITESAMMHEPELMRKALKQIKNAGIKIALDDFGTGYSCLAHLRSFPIDILKIDRSFVMDLDKNRDDVSLIQMIVALGKAKQLTIHAEGVETHQQLSILKQQGCDRIQGFLFSQPVGLDKFESMCEKQIKTSHEKIISFEEMRSKYYW